MPIPFLRRGRATRSPSPPSWMRKRAARRQVCAAAREDADAQNTGQARTPDGTIVTSEVPFRQRIRAFAGAWLADIAKWCRPRMEVNYSELARLVPVLQRRHAELIDARRRVPEHTRHAAFDALWIVVLAEVVAVASLYELVEDLPLPVALLACVAIGGIEAVLGITFGMATAALALSGHHPTFRLAPRERSWWTAMAAGCAVVLVPLVVLLGAMRGEGPITGLLWIVIGLAICALLAAYGAAHYESRPARKAREREHAYQKAADLAHALMRDNEASAEQAVANGVRAVAQCYALNDDASSAFVEEWNADRSDAPSPPPVLQALTLPSDEDVRRMMVVPFPRNLHDDLVACGLTLVHRVVWLDPAPSSPQLAHPIHKPQLPAHSDTVSAD